MRSKRRWRSHSPGPSTRHPEMLRKVLPGHGIAPPRRAVHAARDGRHGRDREAGARELLGVLTRPDADRAALIGRLYERDARWIADVLTDLEVDEIARL